MIEKGSAKYFRNVLTMGGVVRDDRFSVEHYFCYRENEMWVVHSLNSKLVVEKLPCTLESFLNRNDNLSVVDLNKLTYQLLNGVIDNYKEE